MNNEGTNFISRYMNELYLLKQSMFQIDPSLPPGSRLVLQWSSVYKFSCLIPNLSWVRSGTLSVRSNTQDAQNLITVYMFSKANLQYIAITNIWRCQWKWGFLTKQEHHFICTAKSTNSFHCCFARTNLFCKICASKNIWYENFLLSLYWDVNSFHSSFWQKKNRTFTN